MAHTLLVFSNSPCGLTQRYAATPLTRSAPRQPFSPIHWDLARFGLTARHSGAHPLATRVGAPPLNTYSLSIRCTGAACPLCWRGPASGRHLSSSRPWATQRNLLSQPNRLTLLSSRGITFRSSRHGHLLIVSRILTSRCPRGLTQTLGLWTRARLPFSVARCPLSTCLLENV